MKNLLHSLLLGAALVVNPAMSAVLYEFAGTSTNPFESGSFSFTFLAADFITADTVVLPGPNLTCVPACQKIALLPSHPGTVEDSRTVEFTEVGGLKGTFSFHFEPDAFVTLGVHETFLLKGLNDGTLTVSQPGGGDVPEPASAAMLALFAIVVMWRMRGKLRLAPAKR